MTETAAAPDPAANGTKGLLLGEAIDVRALGFALFVVCSIAVGRRMPVKRG